MGSKDIQRSIRSARHTRSAGDAPDIGRVSRVPGTGIPRDSRRRKRRSGRSHKDDSRRIKVFRTWMWVFSAVSVLALVYLVVAGFRSQLDESRQTAESKPEVVPEKKRVESEFKSPTSEDALAMVEHGLAVRDPLEVGDFFRLGSIRPEEAVAFLEEIAAEDGEVVSQQWLSSIDANGLLLEGVLIQYGKPKAESERLAILTPDEKGHWRIDFEAFARTTRPGWDAILNGDAREAVVRVISMKDSYFNGPFRDESEWTCYGLATPDIGEIIHGYCRVGSAQDAAMRRISRPDKLLQGVPRPKRATLKLRRLPEAGPRQFEIERVIAEDWVATGAWFDEGFE